jgi:hypothetical protein
MFFEGRKKKEGGEIQLLPNHLEKPHIHRLDSMDAPQHAPLIKTKTNVSFFLAVRRCCTHHSRGVRCPHTQILALHALTTFISLSFLFNLLKELTLYDINEENHSKNTKQPLDLSYICFASNSI